MSSATRSAVFVFDLDGTLVDSLPDIRLAMNKLLADLGRAPASSEEILRWVGDGASILVDRAMAAGGGLPAGWDLSDLTAAYIAHYRGHAAIDSKPYPGVVETLSNLFDKGHVMAVCTNKPRDLAIELLDGLNMSRFFKAILGGDSVPAKKPNPGHLQATIEALGPLDGAPVVMVGDSKNDVMAARGVGVPVVTVSFGYGDVKPADLGGDAMISDFTHLPDVALGLI